MTKLPFVAEPALSEANGSLRRSVAWLAGAALPACLPLLTLTLLAGCSSPAGSIVLDSSEQRQSLTQSFPHAFISQSSTGEYDLILVDAATNWDYASPKKNKPLEPTPPQEIRQLVHIHLYWRPLMGTTKNPAATNASIDWYVLGPDGSGDCIVYEGAGYVSLSGSGSTRTLSIRDGELTPKTRRGNMHDPVGPAKLAGSAKAKLDNARVRETLAEVEKQVGLAQK